MQYYFNEVNIHNYIGNTVFSAHTLPYNAINTFYPVFFMLKELLSLYKINIQTMEDKKNKFNNKFPDLLFASD